jgi:hypothetical protein
MSRSKFGILIFATFLIATFVNNQFALAGNDRVAPSVNFVIPTNNQTIGDGSTRLQSYYFEVSATDSSGVRRADLYVDGAYSTGLSFAGGAKWYGSWDVRTLANGSHTLEVRAEDARGNIGRASTAITFNNGPQTDFTPPVVNILSPADGTIVKKRTFVTLQWKASDAGVGVSRVFVYIGGVNGPDPEPKCIAYGILQGDCYFTATASGQSGEIITVDVVAWDYEGNQSTSTIHFKIQ